jgi:hypothetical protein
MMLGPVEDSSGTPGKGGQLFRLENNTHFRVLVFNLPTGEREGAASDDRVGICSQRDVERARDDFERVIAYSSADYKPHYSLTRLLLLEPGTRVRFRVSPKALKPLAEIEVQFVYDWEVVCDGNEITFPLGVRQSAYFMVPMK